MSPRDKRARVTPLLISSDPLLQLSQPLSHWELVRRAIWLGWKWKLWDEGFSSLFVFTSQLSFYEFIEEKKRIFSFERLNCTVHKSSDTRAHGGHIMLALASDQCTEMHPGCLCQGEARQGRICRPGHSPLSLLIPRKYLPEDFSSGRKVVHFPEGDDPRNAEEYRRKRGSE